MDPSEFSTLFDSHNKAVEAYKAGDINEAIAAMQRIVSCARQFHKMTGETKFLMMCLTNPASFLMVTDNVSAAISATEEMTEFARSIGDMDQHQKGLHNLRKLHLKMGAGHLTRGELDKATDSFRKASGLARESGDERDQARCLGNMATVTRMRGDLRGAIDFHKNALALFRSCRDVPGYVKESCNLGNAYMEMQDFGAARVIYEEALNKHKDLMEDVTLYGVIKGLGVCAHMGGEWAAAKKYYGTALDMARINGLQTEVNILIRAMGQADNEIKPL